MKCFYCEKEHDSDYICDEMFGSHAKSVLSLHTKTTSEWFEGILDPSRYRLFDFGQGVPVPMDEIEQVVVRENGELECWPSIVTDERGEK